jgi:hypothetical protein
LRPALDGGLPAAECLAHPSTRDARIDALVATHQSLLPRDKPRTQAVMPLDLELLISLARLSGAQSNHEILKMVKLQLDSSGRLKLPFTPMQVAMLRHRAVVAVTRDQPVVDSQTVALMECALGSDPREAAVALARIPRSTSEPLNRIRLPAEFPKHVNPLLGNPTAPPKYNDNIADPCETTASDVVAYSDVFVRLALLFGHNFARELYCNASFVNNELDNTLHREPTCSEMESYVYPTSVICTNIVHRERAAQASLWNRAGLALDRHFGWGGDVSRQGTFDSTEIDTFDNTEHGSAATPKLYHALRDIRDRLFAVERDCGLPFLGHYVQLLRALREQLLTPAPRADGQGDVELLLGAVTLETIQRLTVASLPGALKELLATYIPEVESMNALEVYNIVRERLVKLIEYHNLYLAECVQLLSMECTGELTPRPQVEWPFITPHHVIVSTELLDEVLVRSGNEADIVIWDHLDEVLVGLPTISMDIFPISDEHPHYVAPVFLQEPSPPELFPNVA